MSGPPSGGFLAVPGPGPIPKDYLTGANLAIDGRSPESDTTIDVALLSSANYRDLANG